MGRTHLLFIFAAALQTIAFASTSESISEGELSVELTSKFHMWTQAHGKFYDDHKEQKERLRIWAQNDGKSASLLFFFWNDWWLLGARSRRALATIPKNMMSDVCQCHGLSPPHSLVFSAHS